MPRVFRDYNVNQPMLFGPDVREWLSDAHPSHFISDVVEKLDLTKIYKSYESKGLRGAPPIDPRLLLKIMIYGYSIGTRSSRKLEKATYEDVAFRILSCDQHPDHDTIAAFRRRHIKSIHGIFLQVLTLCQEAGLVKMGHVSLDGTKVKASANKSKSRNYEQAKKSQEELNAEIRAALTDAKNTDAAEDKKYGKGRRGDELPLRLKNSASRKIIIDQLLAKIEVEATQRCREYVDEKAEKKKEDDLWMEENGEKFERRPPVNPNGKSVAEIVPARRNPTDYDSRIMKEHQSGGHIQGYNCQAAVDADSQVIVAAEVTNQVNDKQLAPKMMAEVEKNTGKTPKIMTADNGYFSERDIVNLEKMGIDPYIPPTSNTIGKRHINVGQQCRRLTVTAFMREKLNSKTGGDIYRKRKTITEPVFGQLKEARRFRTFLLRGTEKVRGEWQLMAICHNLGKLHKAKA